VAWLGATTGWLPAVLAFAAIAFYVGVYTMALKRRTPQNIVWGGAAGCMPVLIGWSAVTGSLAWTPVVLFAVIFFWTPPHYWPLSMRFRDDYAAAGVPMLPVVAGNLTVARQIVAYSWVMVATSLALWPVAGTTPFYGAAALLLGAAFLREAYRLLGRARTEAGGAAMVGTPVEAGAMRLFHGSITYLTLLFLAVAIDPLLPF
jgi:protoheme IX farnesyltransferase